MRKNIFRLALCAMLMAGVTVTARAFTDVQLDLTNGNYLTTEEKGGADILFGVATADDGSAVRVDATDASAVMVVSGKFHDNQHGWAPFNAQVSVDGPVKITIGNCQYGYDTTVKAGDETVLTLDQKTPGNCYTSGDVAGTTTSGLYLGEATTLMLSCPGYIPYIAIEEFDPHTLYVKEKLLYSTNFSDWGAYETKASTQEKKVTWTTKYSHEDLTFAIFDTQIGATNFNTGKFPDWEGGMLMAAKSDDPYIITSPLESITHVHYRHGATGSNRGWRLEAKGEGDEDWVLYSETVANPATGVDVEVDINKTNCQLRFTNINPSQNAYMFEIAISGMVDMSKTPTLGTFAVNGVTYEAGEIFDEDENGNMAATVEISKTEPKISEANPVTDITADNGVIGTLTYATDGDNTIVTIPVTANDLTVNYVLTVVQKPDFTLTYLDTDGETVLATQTVEKDAAIGTFIKGAEDATVADGYKFRGWFVNADGGRKYTTADIVLSDLTLYGRATEIETTSTTKRYDYKLNDQYFYAEDHEAFMPTNGSYHDGTHGWEIKADGKIDLLVGGHAYIMPYVCRYTNSSAEYQLIDSEGNVVATCPAYHETDGKSMMLEYKGSAGTVTLKCNTGYYLHMLSIVNVEEAPMEKNDYGYYVVEAGNAKSLITAIDMANATATKDTKTYIFVPDGTYDLGTACLTNISGDNISLIGQSMDGTIIVNHPEAEGIGITATILNTGTNTYIQDITLQNALPYYNSGVAGRAVCLQDKGKNTICKNVRMLSYQDTYYSNAASKFYWETSDIHGTVDFICGDGDVYFNQCTLTVEPRNADGSGECTLTAPYTSTPVGYVFSGCTIDSKAAKFNFGRAWGGTPRCAYINTTLLQPSRLNTNRWTAAGMNVVADKFVEYNTMDADGNVISPASHVMKFTKDKNENTFETILTAEEAENYALDKVYTDWRPETLAAQKEMAAVTIDGKELSWKDAEENAIFAIFKDGVFVTFTGATSCAVDTDEAVWSVRKANSMGGLGSAAIAQSSSIKDIINPNASVVDTDYYNLQGIAVNANYKGIVIRVDTLSDGTQAISKVIR